MREKRIVPLIWCSFIPMMKAIRLMQRIVPTSNLTTWWKFYEKKNFKHRKYCHWVPTIMKGKNNDSQWCQRSNTQFFFVCIKKCILDAKKKKVPLKIVSASWSAFSDQTYSMNWASQEHIKLVKWLIAC